MRNGGILRKAAYTALRAAGYSALILIFVFPLFFMISTSFKSLYETNITPPSPLPREFHPENYLTAWRMMNFPHYLLNSILTTALTIAGQLLVCVPCAYAFAKKQFRLKRLLYGVVIFDLIVPAQVIFLSIYRIESRIGWLDTLRGLSVPFFYSAFTIFFLTQYFKAIPDDVLDAARMDRSSEPRIITRIMMPMSKPVIITSAVFTFVYKWNDYFWTSILTTNETARTLPMAIQNLMPVGHAAREWHILMAGNLMLFAPMFLIYILANKFIKQSFMYGRIK
jgi:sn-glycerol 3-phosphate transport system permease protein